MAPLFLVDSDYSEKAAEIDFCLAQSAAGLVDPGDGDGGDPGAVADRPGIARGKRTGSGIGVWGEEQR